MLNILTILMDLCLLIFLGLTIIFQAYLVILQIISFLPSLSTTIAWILQVCILLLWQFLLCYWGSATYYWGVINLNYWYWLIRDGVAIASFYSISLVLDLFLQQVLLFKVLSLIRIALSLWMDYSTFSESSFLLSWWAI